MNRKIRRERHAFDTLYNRFIKRILDMLVAGTILLVIWPLYLIIGLMIIADDGFPIFYRGERGGYQGKTFRICKFRTMVKNADKIGGGTTALNDPRITYIGNILGKTKLDELPQIGQVFTGKMSFVGPRPELIKYVEQYEGEEKNILQVRPGITDFSSVKFISLDEIVGNKNADEMYERYVLEKKNKLRIKYAQEVSFKIDVYLFFKTISSVLGKVYRMFLRNCNEK